MSQSAIPVYYGSIANGDADLIVGGPHVFQKMILEGVPIKILATWAPLDVLSVITADPAIKSLADLKGKSLAAAVGSSEYQVTAIYGRKLGLTFGTDVTVVSAAPPLARAQLEAKRVDAAMLWEPTTTLALRDNPAFRVIMSGDTAWKAIANVRGWDLVVAARDDFLKRNAALVPRLIAMLQETQKYMKDNRRRNRRDRVEFAQDAARRLQGRSAVRAPRVRCPAGRRRRARRDLGHVQGCGGHGIPPQAPGRGRDLPAAMSTRMCLRRPQARASVTHLPHALKPAGLPTRVPAALLRCLDAAIAFHAAGPATG